MNNFNLNKVLKGKNPTNISIDKEARAIYFKMSDEEVTKTVRVNDSLSVDYDKQSEIVGIEIIRVNKIEMILRKALNDISAVIPSKLLVAA